MTTEIAYLTGVQFVRDHAPVETRECTAAIRLLDGRHGGDPDATEQFSPEVRGLRPPRSAERGPATEGVHGGGGQNGARRVRRGHDRYRLSPLPGSDETKWEDPFATGRRGACDLVDNARTFHLEYDAL